MGLQVGLQYAYACACNATAVVHKLLRMCTPKAFNSKTSMKTQSSLRFQSIQRCLDLYIFRDKLSPRVELVVLIQYFGHNI